MIDKDKEYIWHPYTALSGVADNIFIESANGVYLYTPEGRKILDAVSSWWVNLHGHSNEYIAEIISRQAKKMEHVIFAGFTHEPAIVLAERLLQILPGDQNKIFFSDNGSTAVEVGVKMAVQYWYNLGVEKKKIVAIEGGFHGDTFGAMSVGGRGAFSQPFNALLFETEYIDFPSSEKEDQVIKQFENIVKQKDIAAFIYEPLVQGAAGMRIYSVDVLNKLMGIAQKHEVLCIADEVMTGFGRTGRMFASDYLDVSPDIVCMSKGITGGVLPLGATSCNAKVISAFESSDANKTFFHGHSFTGNPIICATANASLDILQSQKCQDNIRMISKKYELFKVKLSNHKNVKMVDSLGVILSIELKTSTDTGYFNELRNYLYKSFLEKNILLRPLGNVIYILPPYIITERELDYIYESIIQVINDI